MNEKQEDETRPQLGRTRFWLSFASEETGAFLGVVIVDARNVNEALRHANAIGCNPGGNIMPMEIFEGSRLWKFPRERLLLRTELEQLLRKNGLRMLNADGKELPWTN